MGVHAVIGQRNGHIGLSAAKGGIKLTGLRETQVPRSGKAKHHFAKGNYFCHINQISTGLYTGTKVFIMIQAIR